MIKTRCKWMFGIVCVWLWPALGWAQPAAPQATAAIMPAPTDQATLIEHHAQAAQAVFESLSARDFAVIASSDVERQIHQLEPSIRNCRTDADCMREIAKLMGTQYAIAVVVWPKEKSREPSRVAVYMVAANSDAEANSDQLVLAGGVAQAASQAAAQAWGKLGATATPPAKVPVASSAKDKAGGAGSNQDLSTVQISPWNYIIAGSLLLPAAWGLASFIRTAANEGECRGGLDASGLCEERVELNALAYVSLGVGVASLGGALFFSDLAPNTCRTRR
jgi:hypothetical protein